MTDADRSRSRGAQPGNRNRLKHGYYARAAKTDRARLGLLLPIMDEALGGLHAFAVRRAQLRQAPGPKRKIREMEKRTALMFFEFMGGVLEIAGFLPQDCRLRFPGQAPAPDADASGENATAPVVSI